MLAFDYADPLTLAPELVDELGLEGYGPGLGSWLSKFLRRNKNTISKVASIVPAAGLLLPAGPQPQQLAPPPAAPSQSLSPSMIALVAVAALLLLRK